MHPLIYLAALAAGALAQGSAATAPVVPVGAGMWDLLVVALQTGGTPLVLLLLGVIFLVRGVKMPAIPLRLEGPLTLRVDGPLLVEVLDRDQIDEERRTGTHG